jgi:hypothetical protein
MSQLDDLLEAVGAAPALPGAKCRGMHHLFDAAQSGEDPAVVDQRHTQAQSLCATCGSLSRCRDWVDGLKPSKRPAGVVAGLVWQDGKPMSEHRPGRPRNAAS